MGNCRPVTDKRVCVFTENVYYNRSAAERSICIFSVLANSSRGGALWRLSGQRCRAASLVWTTGFDSVVFDAELDYEELPRNGGTPSREVLPPESRAERLRPFKRSPMLILNAIQNHLQEQRHLAWPQSCSVPCSTKEVTARLAHGCPFVCMRYRTIRRVYGQTNC